LKLIEHNNSTEHYTPEEYQEMVIRSSLWAAAGDAIGWITELSGGESGVKYRAGQKVINEPVAWKRKIGGRYGASIDLPAGTYSDDTQLRLSVGRAIRGDGIFDVEIFAKVELPVWQSYSLGAGIGSMAAAANLTKKNVNWFSNFFKTKKQQYTNAGGNGAAMRIQPHVWSSFKSLNHLILQVLRDSIVTHGHPHGFCGAVFHALCLRDTILQKRIPAIERALDYIDIMNRLPSIIEKDSELATFWKGAWEKEANLLLETEITNFQKEAKKDIEEVLIALNQDRKPDYHEILTLLGCLTPKYRGSGFKTAFAAFVLANLYQNQPEKALSLSANELESDTDTIATMTGAILGVVANNRPKWMIQDLNYLVSDATRLASIALGKLQLTYGYPDLARWKAPTNQSDAVANYDTGFALAGFGKLQPISKEFSSKNAIWQWFRLPFGQSILAKRRVIVKKNISNTQMPSKPLKSTIISKTKQKAPTDILSLPFETKATKLQKQNTSQTKKGHHSKDKFPGLDVATSEVINSGFDDEVFGYFLNLCIDESGSIENAMAFSAIVAKAKIARRNRGR